MYVSLHTEMCQLVDFEVSLIVIMLLGTNCFFSCDKHNDNLPWRTMKRFHFNTSIDRQNSAVILTLTDP